MSYLCRTCHDNLDRTGERAVTMAVLRHDLARAELMHRRTAEHLRAERERRRRAERDNECRKQTVLRFLGSED